MSDEQAKHINTDDGPSGNWVLWCCSLLAIAWWGAIGSLAYLQAEAINLAALSWPAIVSAGLLALVPGLLLLLAGIIARQSIRSRAANQLILQAAGHLLTPARTAVREINTLAQATGESARTIDHTTSEALASMKAMHEALSAERLRAESVSYAMADNARELSQRLAEERNGLETLTKAMDAQASMMREVIPQQSAAMVAAAKAAGEEVAAADSALESRLNQLKQAGSTLAVRLTDLDAIAKDATERTDGLVQSIAAIEDRLSRSDKTVERAEQSSAMAVEAANSVGNALQQAVSAALDGAREANEEIDRISRKLHEDTARSVNELRLAGIDATKDPLELDQRVAPDPDRTDIVAQHAILSRPTKLTQARNAKNGHAEPSPQQFSLNTATTKLPVPTAPTATDGDLFESSAPSPIDPQDTPPHINVHASHQQEVNGEAGWSDIISDLDDEDSAAQTDPIANMDRQDIAINFMDRLQVSGIALPDIFRPRDKKKIAAASRKSADARHNATRNAGGDEVTRVRNRLNKDSELNALANAFVGLEQEEALRALAETSTSPHPASPRLAAFLLADAALASPS